MIIDFKYENGMKVKTKLDEIGVIESMAKNGSDIQYGVMLKEGKFVWILEKNIVEVIE